jgi:hypothetical protein
MAEEIIKKGTANRWKGHEAIKGKLYLTRSRMIHIASALHFRTGETEMPLEEIKSVKIDDSMLLKLPIPNALTVTMKDGTSYKFVVNRRKDWKKKVDTALASIEKSVS